MRVGKDNLHISLSFDIILYKKNAVAKFYTIFQSNWTSINDVLNVLIVLYVETHFATVFFVQIISKNMRFGYTFLKYHTS